MWNGGRRSLVLCRHACLGRSVRECVSVCVCVCDSSLFLRLQVCQGKGYMPQDMGERPRDTGVPRFAARARERERELLAQLFRHIVKNGVSFVPSTSSSLSHDLPRPKIGRCLNVSFVPIHLEAIDHPTREGGEKPDDGDGRLVRSQMSSSWDGREWGGERLLYYVLVVLGRRTDKAWSGEGHRFFQFPGGGLAYYCTSP